MRRFREAYIGAIFTFFGQKYRVHSHLADAIELERAEPNLKTEPKFTPCSIKPKYSMDLVMMISN